MADLRIRLKLEPGSIVKDSKTLADQVKRSLGDVQINGSLIDLGDSSKQIQDLTSQVLRAKAVLADPAASAEIQREIALFEEALRFKRQLAQIGSSALDPKDAATARTLAAELNRLNLEKITRDFDALEASLSGFADGSQRIEQLTTQLAQAQIALSQTRSQAGLADETDTAELQKQVALLQEARRYKAELAQIDNAGLGPEDSANAKALADQLNRLNLQKIEQEFVNASGAAEKYQAELARAADVQANLDLATASVIGGAGLFASTIKGLASDALQTGAAFEQLSAALTTAFGEQKGSKELERIQQFASKTPFQVDGLTNSFLKLVNRGFVPTNEELTKIGDLAASQSKNFDQLVEAILDAQSGEFERLKEFGIRASAAGDQVSLTFRGVTTTVEKNEEAIRNALIGYGTLEGIQGSLANQSATLSGQLSNFQDGLDQVNVAFFEFAEGGAKEFLGLANQLVGSFLALPTPVKNTVFAVTGFSAVLAAAIAALATYNFAMQSAYVAAVKQATQQTINTALTLKDNVAKGVSATLTTAASLATTRLTAAQVAQASAQLRSTTLALKDNVAKSAGVAVQTALALATGQATAAQTAQLATLAKGALAFGAIAAAVAAVAIAVDTFKVATQASEETTNSINKLEEGINAYREATAKVGQGTEAGFKALQDQILANQKAVEDSIPSYQKLLDNIRQVFGEGATAAQDAIDSQSLGFSTLVEQIENGVLKAYDDLKAAPGGLAKADAEQRQALLDNIDSSIAALEAEKPVSEEAARARDIYLASLRASKEELEAVAKSGDAATLSVEEQTKALKSLSESFDTQSTTLENANKQQQAIINEGLANQSTTEKEAQEALLAQEQTYLEQRLALNQSKLTELQNLLTKTTDPAALKELQEQIAATEAQVYDDRIQLAENAAEEQQRIFDEQKKAIEDSTAEELAIQETANKEEEALIQEALARGDIDEEQARKESLAREQIYLNNRIALNQEKLAELAKLQATTTDEDQLKEIADKIRQVEGQIYDDRASLAKQAAEERQRIEEEALKKIEEANAEASAKLAQQQADATAQIRQAQLSGAIDEDEAQRQITALQAESAQFAVDQKEQELAQIRQLRDQGVLSAEEAADKERSLITEIAQANVSALEAQITLQEAARQAEIEAIQEAAAAESRAVDQAIAGYDTKINAIERANASLQRQSELLDSQSNLQNALIGLDQARAQTTLDRFTQAEQIFNQLASGELQSLEERRIAEEQLRDLGFSRNTELIDIVTARQQAEANLAAQEREALNAKQQQERASLELQLQQNALADRRNLLEARRTELAAQRDTIEARAALREAQLQGDDQAIADAQQGVELAEQSANLASQSVLDAQEQIDAQAQIATNARAALDAQQEAERILAASADEAGRYADNLERAAAASQRTRTGGSAQPRSLRVGGSFDAGELLRVHRDEFIVPSYQGTVLNQRDSKQIIRDFLAANPDQARALGLKMGFTSSKVATPSVASVAMNLKHSAVAAQQAAQQASSRVSPGNDLLKAVQILDKRVADLASQLKKVKRPNVSPTVQVVNSQQPLSDAMKAYNDILAASYRGF